MSTLPAFADVLGETGEGREDADVVLIVGAQLEAVALRNNQRHLENVDRIEAEAFAVQRRLRIDRFGSDLQVEGLNEERGNLTLQIGLNWTHRRAETCGAVTGCLGSKRCRISLPLSGCTARTETPPSVSKLLRTVTRRRPSFGLRAGRLHSVRLARGPCDCRRCASSSDDTPRLPPAFGSAAISSRSHCLNTAS